MDWDSSQERIDKKTFLVCCCYCLPWMAWPFIEMRYRLSVCRIEIIKVDAL